MKGTRRYNGATFKAQVAFAAVKGGKTAVELAGRCCVHTTQNTEWIRQLTARAADVLAGRNPHRRFLI